MTTATKLLHYYRKIHDHDDSVLDKIVEELSVHHSYNRDHIRTTIQQIELEYCYNIQTTTMVGDGKDESSMQQQLTTEQIERLEWLLAETFEPHHLQPNKSFFLSTSSHEEEDGNTTEKEHSSSIIVEYGPRMTFTTAFSSNVTNICVACNIPIARCELSRRYRFHYTWDTEQQPSSSSSSILLSSSATTEATSTTPTIKESVLRIIHSILHDRMTEQVYEDPPIKTFDNSNAIPTATKVIPIMEHGRAALEEINTEMGLGFDDFDLDYYTDLFKEKLKRNPTDVECFDMGQSNSEHSRHWFFSGKMIIDGIEKPQTLFQLVKATLPKDIPNNSIIAFHDNSSSIRGYECDTLHPNAVHESGLVTITKQLLHPILTAETHNFPSGIAPFPGAETGTGGRLRDVMATGRGAYCVAGISSYCVGNLNIPGYDLPWEDKSFVYPSNMASPLKIEIEASNGASDYGNKFGEPVIHGFTRSFGQRLPNGERYEWVKPIMFSAGVGQLDGNHTVKGEAEKGMLVVKVGGPAYRIGIGGGAASSRVQSTEHADLDFGAVQRGDAEMGNRLNRLMRACCDLRDKNPIISVHDQGAGGNGNVLKEIVEPAGAEYDIRKIYVGDETLSVLEIWGAEYQENNALLIRPADREIFEAIAARENCPIRILGEVTGDGKVVVRDSNDGSVPVDLPLELVLGKMPQKTFVDEHIQPKLLPLAIPDGTTVEMALDRVLRLLSVGSKRFLVHKVDRSVTGLCAQQQCVGPLQLPLADVGVTAHSYFGTTGTAVACGEQPIKGLISAAAMARMTVAEAMTNIMWAKISKIEDIKASGNWMYAAKLPGEGAKMYDACEALKNALLALGVGIDGGKDSLSMAARCGDEVVKAPGELTLTCYVTCPDITKTVTCDLKCPEVGSRLLFIDLGQSKSRVGGSALAQVFNQIGDDSPDLEDFEQLKVAIHVTQELIDKQLILSGHDRSDGGLVVTLMEMAFAGNCSIAVNLTSSGSSSAMELLFNEECGFVLEVATPNVASVMNAYSVANISVLDIGSASPGDSIVISVNGMAPCVTGTMTSWRDIWEATSFQLEKRQRNPSCVAIEEANLKLRQAPQWNLSYTPHPTSSAIMNSSQKYKVGIIRQEGSNGDREMIAAFISAGLEVWDVTVSDIVSGRTTLDQFRGIVFVGGFSYADALDSGKGWAGVIKFNPLVIEQFQRFRSRTDTFSLGVCNGCQLMALLGWVPTSDGLPEERQPRFLHNSSGRFESRFSSVMIKPSPAVLFKGMEGSSLGVWVAHGEGRAHFPDKTVFDMVMEKNLAPLQYVNDSNEVALPSDYPFNPNGSPLGIAALCSPDGRHLAMMPHPERVFTTWQWPWVPDHWKNLQAGPWLTMFQNARLFCDQTK